MPHTFISACHCMAFSLRVCVPMSSCSPLTRTQSLDLEPMLLQCHHILPWLYLQRLYFHIRSHSQTLGVGTPTYLLGEHNSTHIRHNINELEFLSINHKSKDKEDWKCFLWNKHSLLSTKELHTVVPMKKKVIKKKCPQSYHGRDHVIWRWNRKLRTGLTRLLMFTNSVFKYTI